MAQIHSGFILESVFQMTHNKELGTKIKALIEALYTFEMTGIDLSSPTNQDTVFALAHKIISSAYQTKAPLYIENIISSEFDTSYKEIDNQKNIHFRSKQPEKTFAPIVLKNLHVIDPRIKNIQKYLDFNFSLGKSKEGFEESFLFSYVPSYLNEAYFQLLEYNPSIKSFFYQNPLDFKKSIAHLTDKEKKLALANIDFCLNNPYPDSKKINIIEIDNEKHDNLSQKNIDEFRNKIFKDILDYETSRIPTKEFNQIKKYLEELKKDFSQSDYFNQIVHNYENPLYERPESLDWMQIVLSPILISRIESVLIHALLAGNLSLEQEAWNIAIIERDVPAASIAIEDFKALMEQLFKFEAKKRKLPKITLQVYNTPEFSKAKLNKRFANRIKPLTALVETKEFDLLIDASILERMSPISQIVKNNAKNQVLIRSSYRKHSLLSFYETSELVTNSLFDIPAARHQYYLKALNNLEYFVRNIVRKSQLSNFQLKSFDSLLSGKQIISYFSENNDKLIVPILVAFLKSGNFAFLCANANNMLSLKNEISKYFSEVFVLHKFLKIDEKYNKHLILKENKPGFAILDVGCFNSAKFIANFEHQHPFKNYKLIVDQAQRLSDWHTDYSTDFFLGIQNLRNIVSPSSFYMAISHSARYNVLVDISRDLQLPLGNLVLQEKEYRNFNYYVNLSNINKQLTDTKVQKEIIAARKQANTLLELNEYIEQRKIMDRDDSILMIQKPNTELDSEINYNKLELKIRNKHENITVKSIYGSNDRTSILKRIFVFNKNEQASQVNDAVCNLADETILTEIDIKNTSKIIFNSSPLNLENIQSTLGALSNFSGQPEINFNFLKLNDGLLEKEYLEEDYWSLYLGSQREIAYFDELYYGIKEPHINNRTYLKDIILEKYFVSIDFQFASISEKYLLDIYINNKKVGQIDERQWNIKIEDKQFTTIFEELIGLLKSNFGEFDYLATWLDRIHHSDSYPCIKDILSKLRPNKSIFFKVPQENQIFLDIVKEINSKYPDKTDKTDKIAIEYALNQSFTPNSFFLKLANLLDISSIDEELKSKIEGYFYRARTFYQTSVFLNKLKKLGWIKGEFIEQQKGHFVCEFKRQEINLLQDKAKNYFQRYFSQEYVKKAFFREEKLLPQLWEKIVRLYYREIMNFINNSTLELIHFFQLQLNEQEKKSYRNIRAGAYFHAYPYRKQSNKDFNDNLLETTSNLTRKSFEAVREYISQIDHNKSQWFDLLQSSKELLRRKPEYWILNFLYGLASTVVFEPNTNGFAEGLEQIAKAFTQMRLSQRQTPKDFAQKQNFIFSKLAEQNTDLREQVEPVVYLSMHRQWLHQFNHKFLADYEG